MKYARNQNSYEELQTIVEAHLETIEKLRTKLHKFRVLALDEETFNEAREKTTEETFKLPTKWKVKDCKEVSEYASKRFNCNNEVGRYPLNVNEITNYYGFHDKEEGFTEITMEQFLQFVYTPFLDSEGGEEIKTEFTLDRNEIYSLEGTTEEQREKLYQWLLKNDIGWNVLKYIDPIHRGIRYNVREWIFYWDNNPTKYIKDLI